MLASYSSNSYLFRHNGIVHTFIHFFTNEYAVLFQAIRDTTLDLSGERSKVA